MAHENWPTHVALLDAFREEITVLEGQVTDAFDDGVRLYARATLPKLRDLMPGDRFQPGVALRAVDGEIRVHPYTFRQVCSNGAIHAQVVQTMAISAEEL